MARSSELPGFYRLTPSERLKIVKEYADLSEEEIKVLSSTGSLTVESANRMVENFVGTLPVPVGVATNFLINGKDYLVPMATEEPSVIAAASHAAKMARSRSGFQASSTMPLMIGQVQCVRIRDPNRARLSLIQEKASILEKANEQDPMLVSAGGGAKDLKVKLIQTERGPMVIAELLVDCRDAMGANAVNTMAEAVAPMIERLTGGKAILRIISNLASERLARAWAKFPKDALGGEDVVEGILDAFVFAAADPYRAATHNKGIMNGVVAVALATCNDHRAIEAGAHAYAARSGRYMPLTVWEKDANGDLVGSIEMPMAVGTVGGLTKVHPMAKVALKILGVSSARELSEVMAAVGLAQNLAALRALADEGIQRGHMALHARNIAIMAGVPEGMVDKVADQMVREKAIRVDRAKEILNTLKKQP